MFLRDIWPSREEIHAIEEKFVIPSMFNEVYSRIQASLNLLSFIQSLCVVVVNQELSIFKSQSLNLEGPVSM